MEEEACQTPLLFKIDIRVFARSDIFYQTFFVGGMTTDGRQEATDISILFCQIMPESA